MFEILTRAEALRHARQIANDTGQVYVVYRYKRDYCTRIGWHTAFHAYYFSEIVGPEHFAFFVKPVFTARNVFLNMLRVCKHHDGYLGCGHVQHPWAKRKDTPHRQCKFELCPVFINFKGVSE